jgi:hypothetical protein
VLDKLGIDRLHYGVLVTAASGLGHVPSTGRRGLILVCAIARVEMSAVLRYFMPFLVMLHHRVARPRLFPDGHDDPPDSPASQRATVGTEQEFLRLPGGLQIGIDVGGTFTDVILVDPATGQLTSTKVLTTPRDQSEGVIGATRALLREDRARGRRSRAARSRHHDGGRTRSSSARARAPRSSPRRGFRGRAGDRPGG